MWNTEQYNEWRHAFCSKTGQEEYIKVGNTNWLIVLMDDGWYGIFEVVYGRYLPRTQKADIEHAKAYIAGGGDD